MAALPKDLQLELLSEFTFTSQELENAKDKEHFGILSRGGRKLFRYRVKDYRIYFEQHTQGIFIHRVLHKNTLQDFLFRTNLSLGEEDETLKAEDAFWSLINDGEKSGAIR